PEEAERAPLGVDVAGRLPGQDVVVVCGQRAAEAAVRDQLVLVGEVGDRVAAGDLGGQPFVGREAEEEARFGGAGRRGQGQRGGGERDEGAVKSRHGRTTPPKQAPGAASLSRAWDAATWPL